jgi:hypothetical protein
LPQPPAPSNAPPAGAPQGTRPALRPPTSIVWIKEQKLRPQNLTAEIAETAEFLMLLKKLSAIFAVYAVRSCALLSIDDILRQIGD